MAADSVPLVSVSIITYNQVHLIRSCIDSALAQDYPNMEVIVADDGSTDGTAEVVKTIAGEHPDRVFAILSPVNQGVTANSNRALGPCRGKYIAFLAGDDVFLPGKIRKQVTWMEADDRRVLCGHYVEVWNEVASKSEGIFHTGEAGESGIGCRRIIRYGVGSAFLGSCIMIRRSAAPASGFDTRIPLASDWKFVVDVVGEAGVWGTIPEVLSLYRRHGGNVTAGRRAEIVNDTIRSLYLIETERPWLQAEVVPIRRLYEYAWNKELFLKADRGADRRSVAMAVLRPPPGVPRWKALALLVAMCIGGSRLRDVLKAREGRKKSGIPVQSPEEAK